MPEKYVTAGYLGHTVEELEAERAAIDALIVDIRVRPLSRLPMWRQPAMMRFFGGNYVWCQDWGSPNFKQGPPHHLLDADSGWTLVGSLPRNVILLCACRTYETCHRKVLSDWLLTKHLVATEEMDW